MRSTLIVPAALGFLLLTGTIVALSATGNDVDAQIAALDVNYEAMPSPSTVEEALQRNWQYEKEFSEIGGEAPNGTETLSPEDHEDHAIPNGIQVAREDVPGFHLVNMWSGDIAGESVVAASATPESDPNQGGVIVFDSSGQSPFLPAPVRVGELTIQSASGFALTLVATDGTSLTFDAEQRAFK